MRLLALLKKTLLENIRDWKIFILTITFTPFFICLMYFYFGDTIRPYHIAIVNHDKALELPEGSSFSAGKMLIDELGKSEYPGGTKILKITLKENFEDTKKLVIDNKFDLAIEIPINFSKVLKSFQNRKEIPPANIKSFGDHNSLKFIMATAFTDAIIFQHAAEVTGWRGPVDFEYQTVGNNRALTEFDLYVPGLLVLAIIMVMFTAAASLIREKDKGTIIRLRLSKITMMEYLTSITIIQMLLGLFALVLSYLTAMSLGYKSVGSFLPLILLGFISILSLMAISLLVAGMLRTIFDLMTIGCFPFFILMFFSGGMFPLPPFPVFTIAGRGINVNDFLPTTHCTVAFQKILNTNASLSDLGFEITGIILLTFFYGLLGLWLFKKRHLQGQ